MSLKKSKTEAELLLENEPVKKELFIVEGKSAASTIRQAFRSSTQAVLPLQGKLINAQKASSAKVLKNIQCQKLFEALACGIKDACNPSNLNYKRIVILTDPDVDGAHARALLLILIDLYLNPLIKAGLVFVVTPPLFRVRHENGEIRYFWHEADIKNETGEITRFKGIAQFSKLECVDLFLSESNIKQVG
jgi:DNA gyrase/topoisomerase IV subunit B